MHIFHSGHVRRLTVYNVIHALCIQNIPVYVARRYFIRTFVDDLSIFCGRSVFIRDVLAIVCGFRALITWVLAWFVIVWSWCVWARCNSRNLVIPAHGLAQFKINFCLSIHGYWLFRMSIFHFFSLCSLTFCRGSPLLRNHTLENMTIYLGYIHSTVVFSVLQFLQTEWCSTSK